MKTTFAASLCALALMSAPAIAQQAAPTPPAAQPFVAGKPLGVTTDGQYTPMSSNVKVYGGVVSAESCTYDPDRGVILAANRGAEQNEIPNDAFISLINHDGSVNTSKWIGVNRNGLTLNNPFGSDIANGKLYVADIDGGTADGAARKAVIRMFDLKTGAPAGDIPVPEAAFINDIAVASDGAIYATLTGTGQDPTSWKILKIAPDKKTKAMVATVFAQGAPMNLPNGIAFDPAGNIVMVNIGTPDVITFSPKGKVLKTEKAAMSGNDGLVIMADGTKYVSSVRFGGVSKIPANGTAELIASGIPVAASMCYDSGANQLVIPMNPNNSLAFIKLN